MHGVAVYSPFDIRLRAVDAVERGIPKGQVAIAYGINRSTLYRWLYQYQQEGIDGLHRQAGSGRPKILTELSEKELRSIVFSGNFSGGCSCKNWQAALHNSKQSEKFVAEFICVSRSSWFTFVSP